MLNRFLHLYEAINSAITISSIIKYKDTLRFSTLEINFLRESNEIFKIFVKTSTILQASKYPTIQYIYPYIYQIRLKLLAKSRQEDLVSKNLFLKIYLYYNSLLINTNKIIEYSASKRLFSGSYKAR